MSIDFSVEPVGEKPKKDTHRGRRGSKYEQIIEAFLESGHKLVRVDGTGKEANYLAMILKKVIKRKGIDTVKVSVINTNLFLEKTSD